MTDEAANISSIKDLPVKQRRFVEEYCGAARFNGADAARRAGYSEKGARVRASELLTNRNIQKAIKEHLDQLSMTAGEAITRLTEWGRGSLSPFMSEGLGGRLQLDLATEYARENLHLIKKLEQTERVFVSDGEESEIKEVKTKIEIHDAKDAVVQLARIRGLYVDRIDHTSGGKPITKLTIVRGNEE